MLHDVESLRSRGLIERKAKPGRIAGSSYQTRGIVEHAGGMQKAQASFGKIALAVTGIQEIHRVAGAIQHERHRIHAEITPGQIFLQTAQGNLRVLPWNWIPFRTGRGHIQEPGAVLRQSQLELNRAEAIVYTPGALAARGEKRSELLNQRTGVAFKHKIEIRQAPPRIVVASMQQQIANGTSHQRKPGLTRGSR